MIRQDVCYLIAENPERHGVFDRPQRTERMVFCTVRSVYANEFWRAREAGSELTAVFVLADYAEYNGERLLRWEAASGESRFYKIVRSYVSGQQIELTCEDADGYDDYEEELVQSGTSTESGVVWDDLLEEV